MAVRTTKPTSEDADDVALDTVSGDDELNAVPALPLSEATTSPLTASAYEVQPSPPSVDAYSGEGGSYLLDPDTGIRTLIERTLPPTP